MAIGNGLGFTVNKKDILHFAPASIVVESKYDLPFEMIGEVSDTIVINSVQFEYAQIYNAYTKTLNGIYPLYHNADKGNC